MIIGHNEIIIIKNKIDFILYDKFSSFQMSKFIFNNKLLKILLIILLFYYYYIIINNYSYFVNFFYIINK